MRSAGLGLAGAFWLSAGALQAQAPAAAEAPSNEPPLLGIGPETPPSVDPAMMPPLRPPSAPRPIFELHGFAAIWLTLATDNSAPQHATETFRIRWAMLRLDAHPHPDLHVLMRLSFVVEVPLYDLSISWTALPAFNLTFGQFRVPFGALCNDTRHAAQHARSADVCERDDEGQLPRRGADDQLRRYGALRRRAALPPRGDERRGALSRR